MPLIISLNSSIRRLSSPWKGFADTGSSPIGGSEQSAMAAKVSAFRRSTIARRFSRNHSAEESRGSRFEMRKNVLALVETNPRTSFPDENHYLFRVRRYYIGKSLEGVIRKIASHPEVTKCDAPFPESPLQFLDPVEGLPFSCSATGTKTCHD